MREAAMQGAEPPTSDSFSGRLSTIQWKIRRTRFSKDDLFWKWGRYYGRSLGAVAGFLVSVPVSVVVVLLSLGFFSPAAGLWGIPRNLGRGLILYGAMNMVGVMMMGCFIGCLIGWAIGALGALFVLFGKPIAAAILWDAAR